MKNRASHWRSGCMAVAVAAVGAAAAGCAQRDEARLTGGQPSGDTPEPTPPSAKDTTNASVADRAVLIALGRHGATSADETGLQLFVPPLVLPEGVEVAAFARNLHYVSETGRTVEASLVVDAGKTPADARVRVAARSPLQEGEWHWLVAEQTSAFAVADSGDTVVPLSWSIHFLTGSAPRVVGVEFPPAGRRTSPAVITFSEPVDLATVEATRLLSAGDVPIGRCFLRGSDCLTRGASAMADTADLALNSSGGVGPVTLRLDLAFVPGERRAGALAAIEALQAEEVVDGTTVVRRLSADAFRVAADGSRVWRETVEPPSAGEQVP